MGLPTRHAAQWGLERKKEWDSAEEADEDEDDDDDDDDDGGQLVILSYVKLVFKNQFKNGKEPLHNGQCLMFRYV